MVAKLNSMTDRIADVLRKEPKLKRDTIIDVSRSGVRENIHVLVVSRALDEMSEPEKQEYVWGLLDDAVKRRELKKSEVQRVTLVMPFSVEELRR